MDRNFKLSSYQEDILNFVKLNNFNLLVDAKAGSGKTSTLLLIADELIKANKHCLFLSFNKSIVEELQSQLPDLASNIKTVHSLGQSFIRSYLYKKHNTNYEIQVDSGKLRNLCKLYYEANFKDKMIALYRDSISEHELKTLHTDLISDFATICNFIRLYCVDYTNEEEVEKIMNKFCRHLGDFTEEALPNYQELVVAVLNKTTELFENPTEQTPDGKTLYVIDFTDMIYFPVYYNMSIPYSLRDSLDTIMVDECQDLSMLQQMFIKKLYTGYNRFIFVGDKFQSIYGFNGADCYAINKIKTNYNPKELPLNICYRCPEKVVRLAQEIVPSIEWNKAREDKGILETTTYAKLKTTIKPNDVIVGRKNKDLLKIYRDFTLNDHREIKFRNKDMVRSIFKDILDSLKSYHTLYAKGRNIDRVVYEHMQDFSKETGIYETNSKLYKAELNEFVTEYAREHKDDVKSKDIMKTNQTIDYIKTCMREYYENGAYKYVSDCNETEYYEIILDLFDEFNKTNKSKLLSTFLDYLEDFLNGSLNRKGVPVLGSIHSMKGGEADRIYLFDYPRFPYFWADMLPEDLQQEKNMQYVAITRAKKELYLVLLDLDKAKDEKQREKFIELNSNTESIVSEINKICQ